MKSTFGKKDRLKSRKAIRALFTQGQHIKSFPLRLVYRIQRSADSPRPRKILATVSAPARIHRKATQRNLLKRRMREAYRLHQYLIHNDSDLDVDLIFIYNHREVVSFKQIEASTVRCLQKLKDVIDHFDVNA